MTAPHSLLVAVFFGGRFAPAPRRAWRLRD